MMKDSKIKWLGEIPADWEVSKVKRYFDYHKDIAKADSVNYNRISLTLDGVTIRDKEDNVGLQPKGFDDYQIVKKDDLIFKLIDLENVSTSRVGRSNFCGITSPAYILLREKKDVSKYFEYYFYNLYYQEIFNNIGGSGVRSAINKTDLLNIPLLVPPVEKQNIIGDFLDDITKKIDVLIKGNENIINKINDYKKAMIMEYVILEHENTIPKKKSTMPWFKNIPLNWQETTLRHVAIKLNRDIENEEMLICSNSGKVVVRDINTAGLITEDNNKLQGVKSGDLLIHGMDTWHGSIAISQLDGKCTSVVHVCDTNQNKKYIMYYLQGLAYRNVYKKITNGVRENTSDFRSWNKAGTIPIVVPPRDEQERIVKILDAKIEKIEKIINHRLELINKLKDYKKSIIYEYVTGKKEVS